MSDFKQVDVGKIISSVAAKAAEISKECEGDYYDDGLLHCGQCHTLKQSRQINPFTHKEHILPCICECEKARRDEEYRRIEEEKEFLRVKRMRTELIADKQLRSWTFEADDGKTPKMKAAHTYVEKWQQMYKENIGLLLYGDTSRGKTFFAACIANALIDRGIPVLVTSFPKILSMLSGFKTDSNEFINSLDQYKLIIIDDLGVERQSEYALEQVYSVIDNRYKSGKPMIITTNLPISEIKNPKDMSYKRIYERILENCVPMELDGPNRRQQTGANKLQRARELFK